MKEDILEQYKKIAPYIVPALVALALFLILYVPVKPPAPDVLKYKTSEPVGNLCDRLLSLNFTGKKATLGDMQVTLIGITTNESYPMYLAIDKTIWGYYEVRLIRCDPEYAWFPIECRIITTEGDEEIILIQTARTSELFIYTGSSPEGIVAYCTPVAPMR